MAQAWAPLVAVALLLLALPPCCGGNQHWDEADGQHPSSSSSSSSSSVSSSTATTSTAPAALQGRPFRAIPAHLPREPLHRQPPPQAQPQPPPQTPPHNSQGHRQTASALNPARAARSSGYNNYNDDDDDDDGDYEGHSSDEDGPRSEYDDDNDDGARPEEVQQDTDAVDCRRFVKLPKEGEPWAAFEDEELEALVGKGMAAMNVSKMLIFAGYPRSGHSIFGSLLDAHPAVTVANEFGLLYAVRQAQASRSASFFFEGLLRNSLVCAHFGRTQTGYSYQVPDMFQGKWGNTGIEVIGDKHGGASSKIFGQNAKRAKAVLRYLRFIGGGSLNVVHVMRHPLDQIATQMLRFLAKLKLSNKDRTKHVTHEQLALVHTPVDVSEWPMPPSKATAALKRAIHHFWQLFHINMKLRDFVINDLKGNWLDLYAEDLILSPRDTIQRMCDFLGLPCSESYISHCSSIVLTKPTFSRNKVVWPVPVVQNITQQMKTEPLLHRYAEGFPTVEF